MGKTKSTNAITGNNPPFLLQQKRAALKRKISNRDSNNTSKRDDGASDSTLANNSSHNTSDTNAQMIDESKEELSNNDNACHRTIDHHSYDIEIVKELVSSNQERYIAFSEQLFGSHSEFEERPLWRPRKMLADATRVDRKPASNESTNEDSFLGNVLNYLRVIVRWALRALNGLLFPFEVDDEYAYPIEDNVEPIADSLGSIRAQRENSQIDIEQSN